MKKLASKDYITVALYTVVSLVLVLMLSIVTMPFMAWFYPYATGFVLFFSCPIYLLMAYKVGKKGTLLLHAVLNGILYTILGTPFVLPFTILGGLLGEYVLSKFASYRNLTAQTIAYTIYNVIYGMCNYVVVKISMDYYLEAMKVQIGDAGAQMAFMTQPFWIVVTLVTIIVGIILGCLFGYQLLKKHFIKSGLISAS